MINLHLSSEAHSYNKQMPGKKQSTRILSRKGNSDRLSFSSEFIRMQLAVKFKNIGDEHARDYDNDRAIFYYQKAIGQNSGYIQPYYNLARVYKEKGKLDQSIITYKKLLKVKPDEIEAQTLLGHCYIEKEDYKSARRAYQEAIEIDPKYDFAARALRKLENILLAEENPVKAEAVAQQISSNNLRKALKLVNRHASPTLTQGLRGIDITFDETDSLSGHKNIAQYENHNKRIVITSDYIWAAPEITAAYIIHEAVHANDRDGLSSIREEQDAYHESIEFWIAHNNGVKDPELDYAAGLYKENPRKLREKVAHTYRSRDKSIPEYSPNHIPPDKLSFWSRLKIYVLRIKDNYYGDSVHVD